MVRDVVVLVIVVPPSVAVNVAEAAVVGVLTENVVVPDWLPEVRRANETVRVAVVPTRV
jgi:hypothetical protein